MRDHDMLELLEDLRGRPVETEWFEFKAAKNDFHSDTLGKYFSAIANEAALGGVAYGWMIFGVVDKCAMDGKRPVVGSSYRNTPADLMSLKQEVARETTQNVSFLEIFEVAHPDCPFGTRVLMFQIPAAPPGVPIAWKGHYYGRNGESLSPLGVAEMDTIRGASMPDWSRVAVDADVSALSPEAVLMARRQFKEKNKHLAAECDLWDDWTFLAKVRLCFDRRLTRAAIVLLGSEDAVQYLPATDVMMSWVLQDQRGMKLDYVHFRPPFILQTNMLFAKIRNLTLRELPDGSLFPMEMRQYDEVVIREALHNCIAHQDYSMGGRIQVIEKPDELVFINNGGFIPGDVETVLREDAPSLTYRNPVLADAMVQLNMIDTIGSGIKRMFLTQIDRFLPLPDYRIDQKIRRVEVRILGHALDARYTQALISHANLSLPNAIALDRLQKGLDLPADVFKALRRAELVEGTQKKPRISAALAAKTGQEIAYVETRGLEKGIYKEKVLQLVQHFKSVERKKINELLIKHLPSQLNDAQKKAFIKNLLQEMSSVDRSVHAQGLGPKTRWILGAKSEIGKLNSHE